MVVDKLVRPPIVMEVDTDPEEIARARVRRQQFDRNWAWFEQHAAEIYSTYPGKHICIGGTEVFAADSAPEAMALAKAAHPDDDGRFHMFIPQKKMERIYAH